MRWDKSGQPKTGSEADQSYFVTADFFLSFSGRVPLAILDLVRKEEMTAEAVSRKLGIATQTARAKLSMMERQGILVSHIMSQKRQFRLADHGIVRAFDRILGFPAKRLHKAGFPKRELATAMKKGQGLSRAVSAASIRCKQI